MFSQKAGKWPNFRRKFIKKKDMKQVMEMLKVLTMEVRGIRESQKNYEEEIKGLKDENSKMKTKIKMLENKVEMLDKKNRKNNIVIKEAILEEGREKQGVENFIQDQLKIQVKINTAQKILVKRGTVPTIVATPDSWEEKQLVKRNKNKLKGTNWFIDNDLTPTYDWVETPIDDIIKMKMMTGAGKNLTIVQCYAPTEVSDYEIKEHFYDNLNKMMKGINKEDMVILMDINAKIGSENSGFENIMGKEGVGLRNENEDLLLELCEIL